MHPSSYKFHTDRIRRMEELKNELEKLENEAWLTKNVTKHA
jgi:hypothetical protein